MTSDTTGGQYAALHGRVYAPGAHIQTFKNFNTLGCICFNILFFTFSEEKAFEYARAQVEDYRNWVKQHADRADALWRDLI